MKTTTRDLGAWHFLLPNRRLRYGDGRTVAVGQKLYALPEGSELRMCMHGMHASGRINDALSYFESIAQVGTRVWKKYGQCDNDVIGYLCRVVLSDCVIHEQPHHIYGTRKYVARARTVKWMIPVKRAQYLRWMKLHVSAWRKSGRSEPTDELVASRERGIEYKLRNEVMAIHRAAVRYEKEFHAGITYKD